MAGRRIQDLLPIRDQVMKVQQFAVATCENRRARSPAKPSARELIAKSGAGDSRTEGRVRPPARVDDLPKTTTDPMGQMGQETAGPCSFDQF